ncbi:sulfatase-like hydrolase/transferase [Blastopirellula marina]|uniref:Sulfatase n=1 Tax=Blastopirellula marina TaxID=124 RepID=A0A2S8GQB0_9BACT|nr:sulfatase-like hydrolase/transferase [Blastopirellula marina]PQO46204.1 sulfatase [Blastopirellula marina]
MVRLASFLLFTFLITTSLSAEERKPNVIFILADDQGSVDAGCYGSDDLHTPHMDSLAVNGVRFTQFYSAAPVCSPSRAGALTGRWPVRAGVPSNCSSAKGGSGALPSSEITMAEMFKAAGYTTAHIGKWHIGYTEETMPLAQGFDYSVGHMGGCIDNYSHFFYWNGPNRHDLWRNGKEVHEDGRYFPQLMADEACAFIEKNQDKPFFIYYAMNTPHYPYQGEAKWLDHFKHVKYPRNLYAAFIASQDDRIGQLLAKLDKLDLRNDTIIVYQSDNGYSTEVRAHNGGGNSGPYRGAKFSMFEGGIRLPGIISWPGHLPEGEVRGQIAHACDWLPTLAELTGVELPQTHLDGRSQVDVIQDAEAKSPHADHPLHWQVGNGKNAAWAVRDGNWKLVANTRDTEESGNNAQVKLFLANIAEDPGETTNLVDQHPKIVARLTKLHRQEFGD